MCLLVYSFEFGFYFCTDGNVSLEINQRLESWSNSNACHFWSSEIEPSSDKRELTWQKITWLRITWLDNVRDAITWIANQGAANAHRSRLHALIIPAAMIRDFQDFIFLWWNVNTLIFGLLLTLDLIIFKAQVGQPRRELRWVFCSQYPNWHSVYFENCATSVSTLISGYG